MDALGRAPRTAIVAALVLVLAASLALGGFTAPQPDTTTGHVVGQAGFAYLGGLRRFAAAVLWNRLEPLLHGYYADVALAEQDYMLPTLYAVIRLDPQFEQAYYISAWIVFRSIGESEGLAIARDGVAANPRSGLLHANLLQLLFLQDREANASEIARLVDRMMGDEVTWLDDEELFEGLAVVRDVVRANGETERADQLDAALDRLRDAGVGAGDHDHDGDGKQDH